MIDEQRAKQWNKDASVALMQHYGKGDTVAHPAAVIVALLADRSERELFIERSGANER